ncbi:MAG TPA: amino acid adenylation domain-containing protein [Steroidobacteraceae bacterium]|nr:amino acid adenylation domain-containing protein [Steroidobacteraceae bacterium]
MTVTQLIAGLRARDVRVWLEDGRVRVSAPSGSLTPELQQELTARKAEIKAYLASLEVPAEEAAPPETPAGDLVDRSVGEFPTSFAQRRLWFIDRLEPGNAAYIVAGARELYDAIDPQMLEDAVNDVVRKQGSLRTVFREVDGEPVQVVLPQMAVPLKRVDLSALPAEEREPALERLKKEEAGTPFDLATGPLLRVTLVTQSPQRHTLLFTMHHIVCDGWSLAILLAEIHQHYSARSRGTVLADRLPVSYAEYSQRQRQRLSGAALDGLLDYWTRRFAGAPALLELPTDRPRPPQQSFAGSTYGFTFSRELSTALRALARGENATMYMTLLALFKILLYRSSGQTDIVVGTPVATRDSPELERLIGLFVSTLPIRSDLSADPSVSGFIRELRENVLEAQAHRDLPFEKLVEALHPARTAAWSPVFQVAFVLQNTPLASEFQTTSAAAMYDITLFLWDDQAEIRGGFEYSTALFDAATIERLADQLRVLAEHAVENPQTPVSRLPMLSAPQVRQLLHWGTSPSTYPRESSVTELFDAVVQAHGSAVALESAEPAREPFATSRLTYRELADAAARLAATLTDKGVRPGMRVGLYLERSVGTIVTILAVLKAGAVYVPLDPANPRARTKELVRTVNAELLLVPKSGVSKLESLGVRTLAIEALWRAAANASCGQPQAPVTAEDDAYIMFTSGTTGTPKGVRVTHRNIVRLVCKTNYISLGAEDTLLQLAPLAFDASTFEIWGALLNGARLVVHPPGTPTAHELARTLRDQRVTTLWLTSGLFNVMMDTEPQALAQVRHVLAGGDVLSVPHVQALLDAKREGTVVNGYGPTENTTFTCCHVMPAGTKLAESVPIGRPIANTTVYIVDAHDQLVPIGVAGELVTGGDGVARGYIGASASEAQKFTADPFDTRPGARLYRTGDRARWRSDGTLDFLGRNDRQVKVRGFRVELGEVEEALRACDGVRDAAVIAQPDAAGTNEIIAYAVPVVGEALDKVAIRRRLQERLPGYMIPADIVALAALPLTANGKLDRAALPARTVVAQQPVEPRTMIETQLHAIWENVLGYSGFGIRDNFFDLGGHSLLALRIFAQVERVFGRKLAASVMFQAPTIEQLAARLTAEGFESQWDSLVTIQPEGTSAPLFMVPGIGGNVVIYAGLARALGRDQPFYGLQSLGLDGREAPLDKVEDIAAHYIREIRRLQPHGPYSIGGACFGGAVAYEMAQQLRAQSEEVDFLLLVETWPPPRQRPVIDTALRYSHHVRFLVNAARRNLAQLRLSPRMLVATLYQHAKVLGEMIAQRDVYRGDSAAMYVDRVSHANIRAFARYQPQPYDGEIHLVLASARPIGSTQDPRLYWADLARGGVRRYDIPARDSGLILKSPHVEKLSDWLREALRVARQKGARAVERIQVVTAQSLVFGLVSFMTLF